MSIIKEHQVMVLILTGRDFSLGVTERAKLELCFYFRRRPEPAPSGGNDVQEIGQYMILHWQARIKVPQGRHFINRML